jgi:hypothetical protein
VTPRGRGWGRVLPWLFASYAAATLLHFAHNAEYLAQYPNLPASWSRGEVYAAWCCVMALGLFGCGLYALGHRRPGLACLALYAVLGFGGLLHYTRAPLHEHSPMMNLTIWAEAAMGALLLANVALLARSGRRAVRVPSTRSRPAPDSYGHTGPPS